MQHIYDVNLKWENGRTGLLESTVLNDKIKVATPPEFPGGVAGIWSPEHLFVAAINSCFMTTFLAIADNSKIAFESFTCRAEGKLEQVDRKFVITEIQLFPKVEITNEKDVERIQRVFEKSEAACLITNSITSKVTLQGEVNVVETA